MNIEIGVRSNSTAESLHDEDPLNILLVGNFSGSAQQPASAVATNDILNMSILEPGLLDDALGAIAPVLRLNAGALEIPFRSMDDFHPDRLVAGLPLYEDIRALKIALRDPASARQAITVCRDLLGLVPEAATRSQVQNPPTQPAVVENEDNLLSRLLGQPATRPGSTDPRVRGAVQKILEQAGSEGAAPDDVPGVGSLLQQLDLFLAAAVRELLHDPVFQSMETCWRSAEWLMQNLETDHELAVWLVDVGASAAEAWAPAVAERASRSLDSVAQIIVLEEFSDTPDSLAGLEALCAMAAKLNATAYAGAAHALAGVSQLPESDLALDATDIATEQSGSWQQARAGTHAAWVVLGFPRLLLRQPYGAKSDPVDRLEFEELLPAPDHNSFLWGNPAPALAVMKLQRTDRIYDLPMVVYDDRGGQAVKPPCEAYITDSAAERILSRGIVPLIAHRGQTTVQVPQIEPIAG